MQPRTSSRGGGSGDHKPKKEHRRSRRLLLAVPVLVYGRAADNTPFRDVTHTLSVNLHGGLVELSAPLHKGQKLLVVNTTTQEERECIAVYIGPTEKGRTKVGFQFTRPAPNFWKINFPATGPSTTPSRAA